MNKEKLENIKEYFEQNLKIDPRTKKDMNDYIYNLEQKILLILDAILEDK